MRRENWIKLDLDSRMGLKMSSFFNETGATGYGLFWVLTEILYRENGNRMANNGKTDFAIAKMCLLDFAIFCHLKERMIFYGLLQTDGEYIWRDRVLKEVAQLAEKNQEISKLRSSSGKKGAAKRWQKMANDGKHSREDKIRVDKINNNKGAGAPLVIPDWILSHSNCHKSLLDWIAQRQQRKKPVSQMALERNLKIFDKQPERLSKALEHSIANDYQGIYEPNLKKNNNQALETLGGFLNDKS